MGLPPAPGDDLYGLGALAFELLTGTPPYFPDFDVRRVLHDPVPAVEPVHLAPREPAGPGALAAGKGSRRHRPQSMAEVIAGLAAALDDPQTRENLTLGASAREAGRNPERHTGMLSFAGVAENTGKIAWLAGASGLVGSRVLEGLLQLPNSDASSP